jgi:hypothetical protein
MGFEVKRSIALPEGRRKVAARSPWTGGRRASGRPGGGEGRRNPKINPMQSTGRSMRKIRGTTFPARRKSAGQPHAVRQEARAKKCGTTLSRLRDRGPCAIRDNPLDPIRMGASENPRNNPPQSSHTAAAENPKINPMQSARRRARKNPEQPSHGSVTGGRAQSENNPLDPSGLGASENPRNNPPQSATRRLRKIRN